MQTVLISGGTGLIGKKLSAHLVKKGYKLIILTRSLKGKQDSAQLSYASWDVAKQTIDMKAVEAADYVIHLAGAGVVDKRWTDDYKKEIISSRTESSRLIIDSLRKTNQHVKAFVSASATGWYGPDKPNHEHFVETDPAAGDFLGRTCAAWEESVMPAVALNIRVCKLRTGIVLSNEGGALAEFKKPVKLGVGGILGSGRQTVSWIHIEDLCRMYTYALEQAGMEGSYNAVAPTPVSNEELTLGIAQKMKGKFFIPMHVPAFVLKLMLGESSVEVLKSVTVSNAKIAAAGFTFLYPSLEAALNELIR